MSFQEPHEKDFRLFRQHTSKSTSTLPPASNFHRKVASSPYSSPNKDSIPSEIRANSPKNNSQCFNALHSKYQERAARPPTSFLNSSSPKKKYMNNIHRLNQEIQIMSTQLKQAHDTISVLTVQLNEINYKHAQHIQEIHERHEQKIAKLKSDIDKLFQYNGAHSQTHLHRVVVEKDLELEEQQKKFCLELAEMGNKYENRLKRQEKEHSEQVDVLKKQFLDVVEELKDKFLKEIEEVQGRNKIEIDRVREAMKGIVEGVSESDGSTALESENDKNARPASVSGLQMIEELSFQNSLLRQCEELPDQNDLDASLCLLINQIGFDGEVSLSDILSN